MELQNKVLEAFNGKVVRKDLAFLVKGNLPVPTYVLEYLLGQYCATDDPTLIEDGINRVKDIIRNNYINRAEAEEASQQQPRSDVLVKIQNREEKSKYRFHLKKNNIELFLPLRT